MRLSLFIVLGFIAGLLIGASIAYATILPSSTNNVVGLGFTFILGLIILVYSIFMSRKG